MSVLALKVWSLINEIILVEIVLITLMNMEFESANMVLIYFTLNMKGSMLVVMEFHGGASEIQ